MNSEKKGIIILLLASLFFALITIFNRLVPTTIGIFGQSLFRTGIMGIVFLGMAVGAREIKRVKTKDVLLLIFRGLLFVVDFTSFFIAANHLPLGTTLFLFYAGSVISSYIYGFLFLHERINKIKIVSLGLAFIGLFIMYGKDLTLIVNSASFFGVLAGICFGVETATSKHITDRYSVNQVNFITYLTAAVLSCMALPIVKERFSFNLSLESWIIFILFALFGVGAFYATIYGYKYVEAQKASIILLLDCIIVIPIGFIFYREIPAITTIIAGIFIISAVIFPNIKKA